MLLSSAGRGFLTVSAVTWPVSIFELDTGLGLTVCVAHQGAHVFYNGGCVAFAAQHQPKTLRVRLTQQDRPAEPERERIEVQLDETKLAAGIAVALDQLMQRRREERESTPTKMKTASGCPIQPASSSTTTAPARSITARFSRRT
jgi:hypothetical protein